MKNRLIHVFFNVDLRQSFTGLVKTLKSKTDRVMKQGDFVLFMNSKQDMIKMFCSSTNCLLQFKNEKGRINSQTIVDLPNYVQGNSLDYNSALRKVLTKKLGKPKVSIKKIQNS